MGDSTAQRARCVSRVGLWVPPRYARAARCSSGMIDLAMNAITRNSTGLGVTLLPRSVIERSARRREVSIHELPRAHRFVETQFVTHKAQVRSLALSRLLDVLAAQQKSLEPALRRTRRAEPRR